MGNWTLLNFIRIRTLFRRRTEWICKRFVFQRQNKSFWTIQWCKESTFRRPSWVESRLDRPNAWNTLWSTFKGKCQVSWTSARYCTNCEPCSSWTNQRGLTRNARRKERRSSLRRQKDWRQKRVMLTYYKMHTWVLTIYNKLILRLAFKSIYQ